MTKRDEHPPHSDMVPMLDPKQSQCLHFRLAPDQLAQLPTDRTIRKSDAPFPSQSNMLLRTRLAWDSLLNT